MIRLIFSFLFVFLVMGGSSRIVHGAIPAAQRNALIDLYNNTGGTNWTENSNWRGDPGTENTWYGITCDSGNNFVTEIDLRINNLSGEIPDSIGDLTDLRSLALSDNQLNDEIPVSIGSLTSLQYLSLSNNELTGGIPAEIGDLSELTYLSLSNNQLVGTIPDNIGNLESLTILLISNNRLQGQIPEEIKLLTNLIDDRSDFRYNNFSTTVSDGLQTFLDRKQTGGNWEASQGSTDNGTSTPLAGDDDSSCFLRSISRSTE